MIDNQTFEALCQHIAGMVRTEEEAEMLAKRLSRVNWSRYVYPHICAWCGDGYRGKPYLVPEYIYPICPVCDRRLARCLDAQLARARHAQLPATLTMAQWLITMEHFGWTCAYCQEKPGAIIEHFLPLAAGVAEQRWITVCQVATPAMRKKDRSILSE